MLRSLLALSLLFTSASALAAEPSGRSAGEKRPLIRHVERIERASRSNALEQRLPRPMAERVRRSERAEPVTARPLASEAAPRRDRSEPRAISSIRDGSEQRAISSIRDRSEQRAISSVRDRSEQRAVSSSREAVTSDSVRDWRWRERNAERSRRGVGRVVTDPASTRVAGEVLATPRTIAPPVAAAPAVQSRQTSGQSLRNRIATEGWRREWREDRRYDWRRHRDRYNNRFHLGFYNDPFGWNYRRWNVGWRLPSRHFASSYWINDPFYYRLPPAYGSYRWVRYWNDAMLVDIRTGRVVDVIHNFFW